MEKMPRPADEEVLDEQPVEEETTDAVVPPEEEFSEEEEFEMFQEEYSAIMGDIDKATKYKSGFKEAFRHWVENQPSLDLKKMETAAMRVFSMVSLDAKTYSPEVEVLMNVSRAGANGGRYMHERPKGELGNGEMIFEILGSKCEPAEIGRIITESRTIPGTDLERFEQMREDAYVIEHVVIGNRGFIHDQAPFAQKLISAMIEYYDAKDNPDELPVKKKQLEDTLAQLRREHKQGYNENHEDYIFNLEAYDSMGNTQYKSEEEKEMPMIDYLRRLEKNMEPVSFEAPKTGIPELDAAFDKLGQLQVAKSGEVLVSLEDLKEAIQVLNQHLIENRGKRTMTPSLIRAIMYIDRLAMMAVRRMDKKDWREAAYDPTFKEILRFSQLTMSGDYDEREFEGFCGSFRGAVDEAYGEDSVDDEKIQNAYSMLTMRIGMNASHVAKKFSSRPGLEYLSRAVWSGNLTHELMGLADKKF